MNQMKHKSGKVVIRKMLMPWILLGLAAVLPTASQGQDAGGNDVTLTNAPTRLPTVMVTAQKVPQPVNTLPVSVTVVNRQTLEDDDINLVKQAAIYAPNTFINEFTARAVSNPFFRGIGGSPLNPGVTTFIDGVPQLNSYSSSIQFSDVDQVEFVRGPQGALFGRNTAGGLINITSRRPSDFLTGEAEGSYGNYGYGDARGSLSGPVIKDELGLSVAGGYTTRDGYTRNDFNGQPVDNRADEFGKGQLLFKANDKLEFRLIVSGEHDRDGDYALGDLGYIRATPNHVDHDFTGGFNHRDVASGTLLADWHGETVDFESISGGVWWKNEGLTDLDYGIASPANFFLNATRDDTEEQHQFTQEFRLASSKDEPVKPGDSLDLSWQSGVFLFSQSYDQNAANTFAPPLAFESGQTTADLDDRGVGVYGQAKLTAWDSVDVSAGVRFDYEHKQADLFNSSAAGFGLPPSTSQGKDYREVSPQFAVDYRFTSNQMVYASAARGYRAGGFNPIFPPGEQEYGTEHTWNYEVGLKSEWLDGKLETTAALYYIQWDSLQLNEGLATAPGQFFIANAGSADSKGAEFELKYAGLARIANCLAARGADGARFHASSSAFNANAAPPFGANQNGGGYRLPFAPQFTANAGTRLSSSPCRYATLYALAEVTVTGEFRYDAFSNASGDQGQATYSLADFRAGMRGTHWFVEGWADNAFDTHYVPIAIQYGQLGAPSGYVGESGAPVTFGARAGVMF